MVLYMTLVRNKRVSLVKHKIYGKGTKKRSPVAGSFTIRWIVYLF